MRPLILDIGSNFLRLGWAGEDLPALIIPSVYCDKSDYVFQSDVIDGLEELFMTEEESDKYLYGNDALVYQNILTIHEFKKENNFNILKKFFYQYYHQLGISPEHLMKQPIVILVSFFITEIDKAKIQQFLFELNFPMILFVPESKAILSTLQKASGIIVNIGESYSYITSFLHGFSNIMARDTFPIAGKELTDHFLNLILTGKGAGKNLFIDNWLAKEIKEKISICIMDVKGEISRIKEGLKDYNQTVSFPDGSSITLNSERFMVVEPLFNPKLIHIDYIGLPEAISKVVKSWDRENWEELVSTIIITGGGSLIPGLKERLKSELSKHFSDKLASNINIIAAQGRENMSWIGASILHSRGQLDQGWIQNPNYVPPSMASSDEIFNDDDQNV